MVFVGNRAFLIDGVGAALSGGAYHDVAGAAFVQCALVITLDRIVTCSVAAVTDALCNSPFDTILPITTVDA